MNCCLATPPWWCPGCKCTTEHSPSCHIKRCKYCLGSPPHVPLPWTIVVKYSLEDRAYIARIPSLGCMAHGATPEEAIQEIEVAARAIVESMEHHGDELPVSDVT